MKKLLFLFVSLFAVQVAMADQDIASYTFPDEDLAAVDEVNYKATAITADPYTAKGTFVNCSIGMKNVGGYASDNTHEKSADQRRNAYINAGTYYHKLSGNNAYIRFALESGSLKAGDEVSIVVWNNSNDDQGIALGEAGASSYADATFTIPGGKVEKEVTYTLTAEDIHGGSIYIYRQNGKGNFGIKSISIISKSEIINPTKTNFETIARFKFPDTAIGGVKESCSDNPFTGGTTTNCSIGLYKIGGENSDGGAQYYLKNSTIYNKFGANDAYIKITLTERNFAVGDTLYARIWLGTGNLKYGFKFGSSTGNDVTQSETWSSTTKEYILAFELTKDDFSGNMLTLYRCTKNTTGNGMGGDKFGVQEIWINREVSKEVSIGSTGYATFSGATYDYVVPAGCEAFVASSFADNVITISKIVNGIIPANTGVLLKGAKGTYTLTAQAAAATVGTNLFKANVTASELSPTEGDYTNYILVPDDKGGVKFAPSSGSGTLAANRAYLQLPTPAGSAREYVLSFNDDELTGIKAVESSKEKGADVCYDLSGRRVAQPTKGLYIMNGKKYIVK
ncbi:MAG: hypothetical protein ILA25_07495 [Prevotella sp.]|nr:hypothetical protein [Prevotella sp.]